MVACLGHSLCQRDFRTITCRAFPFFPYINKDGHFIGLTYYWQYEERCWVINHLHAVENSFREQFVSTYDFLFSKMPAEYRNFQHHSMIMRRVFDRRKRAIPLLHRNGFAYKITPKSGRMRRVPSTSFSKYGPFKIAERMPFGDEL
jgi:hypothetical protein